MKDLYGIDDPHNQILTFSLINNSNEEKYLILFGSLLNLNDELLLSKTEVILHESSHDYIKRELLSSSFRVREIELDCEKGFDRFDGKLELSLTSSPGMRDVRKLNLNFKKDCKSIKLSDSYKNFTLTVTKNLHIKINLPPHSNYTMRFKIMPTIKQEKLSFYFNNI